MRFKMGKGQVLVFDNFIETKLDALKKELGYYPTLRQLGERCVPPQPPSVVRSSLRRLAATGRLTKEALRVYDSKNNVRNIETGNVKNEKNEKAVERNRTN